MNKLFSTYFFASVIIIGNHANALAQGFDTWGWRHVDKLKASKGGDCNIGKLISVTKYTVTDSGICVDPGSWIKTQDGGRIQWIIKLTFSNQVSIGSAAREVNCRAMEKRHRNIYDFRNFETKKSHGYRKGNDGWWSKFDYDKNYSAWTPIETQDGINKYICSRWRREGAKS